MKKHTHAQREREEERPRETTKETERVVLRIQQNYRGEKRRLLEYAELTFMLNITVHVIKRMLIPQVGKVSNF